MQRESRMKRHVRSGTALLIFLLVVLLGPIATVHSTEQVRPAAVAGAFYPGEAKELGAKVDGFLAGATVPAPEGRIIALVAPHAGYDFSGPVAAYSYAALKGQKVRRVVIIAPSHFESFPFISMYEGDAYTTPLGKVPVDKVFAGKLVKMNSLIQFSSRGHVPSKEGSEHALEVQVPFLQRTVGDFQLVPIIMGEQSYESSRALGTALAELIRDQETLIVASSDLSHYHTYEQANRLDRQTLNAIADWDYFTLSKNLQSRTWEACGGGPIVAAMIAAERLGATKAIVLKYANSGDTSGDRSRVVGYGAVALISAPKQKKEQRAFSLAPQERKQLLEIARKSVESAVMKNNLLILPDNLPQGIQEDRAAFVTIRKNEELRGCVGYTAPVQPLARTVRDVAAMAALRDMRFSPVQAGELSQLRYEVSVLSPFHRVADIRDIRLGEHGVLIKQGGSEALMLPQVAAEQHWDRKTLVEQTCMKAGLPANAWRDQETDIFVFSALVFGDENNSKVQNPFANKLPTRPAERH